MRRVSHVPACLAVIACMCAMHGQSRNAVVSEAIARQVLATVFPHLVISRAEDKRIDGLPQTYSIRMDISFPDTFAGQPVYLVDGSPQNPAEDIASENIVNESHSRTRQVRLKVFYWPKQQQSKLLAILQYDFAGAKPAFLGPTIGLLAELERRGRDWSLGAEYLLEPRHHFSIQRVDLEDVTGDGVPDLIVESQSGGMGYSRSSFQVFDLGFVRWKELINTESRLVGDSDDYTQELDFERTLQTGGRQFCFVKKIFVGSLTGYAHPRIEHPYYKVGEGVNDQEASDNSQMLVPKRR